MAGSQTSDQGIIGSMPGQVIIKWLVLEWDR